jgi:hypothetical protein
VAEKIEIQTRYAGEVCSLDVKQDQRYLAERTFSQKGQPKETKMSRGSRPILRFILYFTTEDRSRESIIGGIYSTSELSLIEY